MSIVGRVMEAKRRIEAGEDATKIWEMLAMDLEVIESTQSRVIRRLIAEGATAMDQKPSVGRIVWYQAFGTPNGEFKPEPRAAIVTAVEDDGTTVHVCVFNPTGVFFNKVPYSEEPKGGTWRWPARI